MASFSDGSVVNLTDDIIRNLLIREADREDVPYCQLHSIYWGHPEQIESSTLLSMPSVGLVETTHKLFVFCQYQYMAKRLEAFRGSVSTPEKLAGKMYFPPAVAIIGTPGIGKTRFLEYYLALELSQCKEAVLFTRDTYYIFTQDGVSRFKPPVPYSFDNMKGVLALVDADIGKAPLNITLESPMFVVQAASPQVEHVKWLRQRPRSVQFVMNPPTVPELCAALKIQDSVGNVSEEEMRAAIEVLTHPSNHDLFLYVSAALADFKCSGLKGLISKSETHALVTTLCTSQPPPEHENYLANDRVITVISTPAIWRIIIMKYALAQAAKMQEILTNLSRVPQSGSTAGNLFEAMCHQWIVSGQRPLYLVPMRNNGTHLVRGDAQPVPLPVLKTLSVHIFHRKELLATTRECDVYYIPSASNNPAFDAFFRTSELGVGLQMSLVTFHTLSIPGLRMLRGRMKDCKKMAFIFVIPKGQEFKCPSAIDMKTFDFYTADQDITGCTAFEGTTVNRLRDGVFELPDDDVELA